MRGVLGLILCLTSYHVSVTNGLDFSNLGIVFGKHHTSGGAALGGKSSAGKVEEYPRFKSQGGGKVSTGGVSSDGNVYPRFKSEGKAEPGHVYPTFKSQGGGKGGIGGGSSDGNVYPRFKSQGKTEPGHVYPTFKSQGGGKGSIGGGSSDGNVYPRFKSEGKPEPGHVYPTFKSQSSVSDTGSTEAHIYPTFKSQGKLSGGKTDSGRVYPTFDSQKKSGVYPKGVSGVPAGKVLSPYHQESPKSFIPIKKLPPFYPKGPVIVKPLPGPYPKPPLKPLPGPYPKPLLKPLPGPYPKPPLKPLPGHYPKPLLKPLPGPYPKPPLKPLPGPYPKPLLKPLPGPYPKPPFKPLPRPYPKPSLKPLPRPYPKPPLKPLPRVYPKPPAKSYPKSSSPAYAPHTFGYFPGGIGKYQSGYFPTYKHHGYNFKVSYKSFPPVQPRPALCPFGWYPYGGSCYLFSREKLEWYHAQMKCQYMGGSLVVIDSANENAFLKLVAKKKSMNPGVWIGLNDVLFHGSRQWFWGYGHKACGLFNWFGKEPVYKGYQKHCVSLWGQYGYKWRLFNCYRKLQYICEINPKNKCLCGY